MVGAGIGGLSFAISFLQTRGGSASAATGLVILERLPDASFHRCKSTSNLSLLAISRYFLKDCL